MNESWYIYEFDPHSTYWEVGLRSYTWAMAPTHVAGHIWMCHGTGEWVIAHIWIRRMCCMLRDTHSYQWVMAHMNELLHMHESSKKSSFRVRGPSSDTRSFLRGPVLVPNALPARSLLALPQKSSFWVRGPCSDTWVRASYLRPLMKGLVLFYSEEGPRIWGPWRRGGPRIILLWGRASYDSTQVIWGPLENTGLFCRISSVLWGSFAKKTYILKEPTSSDTRQVICTCGMAHMNASWHLWMSHRTCFSSCHAFCMLSGRHHK